MTKYVLSIDGGGVRGILPALILAEIEKRSKKPISAIFDLMAGTSTGGILVAGLCKKDNQGNLQHSANDMLKIYQDYGSYIFKLSFAELLISLFSSAKYSDKNFVSVLDKFFGDDVLKNSASKLLLTSYDLECNGPFFFKSWKTNSQCIKIKDALRATAALPLCFTPKRLIVDNSEKVLIDGGVFAYNPALCAYANAKSLFPKDNIVVLSIGTGKQKCYRIDYGRIKSFGKIGWLYPALDIMFNSHAEIVDYQMDKLLGKKYVRIQSILNVASPRMDDTASDNARRLHIEASIMLKNNQKLLDQFCK